MKLIQTNDYLLLIDEEAEIKDCYYYNSLDKALRKNNNLNHSYHYKVIAYYPLTKEAKELNLPLLPNPFENKTDVVALAIEKYGDGYGAIDQIDAFKEGYKAAQQSNKQFSLEDMLDVFEYGLSKPEFQLTRRLKEDFEKFIQSLSIQQLPKEFITEYEEIQEQQWNPTSWVKQLKTITNSEGKEELVGVYRY